MTCLKCLWTCCRETIGSKESAFALEQADKGIEIVKTVLEKHVLGLPSSTGGLCLGGHTPWPGECGLKAALLGMESEALRSHSPAGECGLRTTLFQGVRALGSPSFGHLFFDPYTGN